MTNLNLSDADTPIPSVEDRASPEDAGTSVTTSTTHTPVRTPSVSVSPPPLRPSGTSGIDATLQQLRLVSPDPLANLSDVAGALECAARGKDSRGMSLGPEPSQSRGTPLTPGNKPRSRRSSSQVAPTPHNVRDEEPPRDAFHEPSFQEAFGDAKTAMAKMSRVLESSSLHMEPDSTMRRLHKEAEALGQFQCPSTRTVGFVGDSGVGKSSLLNSLLDLQSFARTSNSGEACTCVVTEYHYHDLSTVTIQPELFTPKETSDHLKDLLESYRHYHLHRDEIDADCLQAAEAEATLAEDTFRAMFQGLLADDDFLIEDSKKVVLERLNSWATELRPAMDTAQTGLASARASNALLKLSSAPLGKEQAAWPYIRKIKVFLNAHILHQGLILVDLPGLRDLNSARRRITERFLLECNEILVVCNIGRAVTDEGVRSVLELARQARLSNVGIVCTKSDDIKEDEARRDWPGPREQKIQGMVTAIATDTRDYKRIDDELKEYEVDDDLSEDERAYERALVKRRREVRQRRDAHAFELKSYLVTTRNEEVTHKLRDQYEAHILGQQIGVFCISNLDYWNHRAGARDLSLPSLQLSGIIGLRKHCIALVSSSQHRIASRYLQHDIANLLPQIQLWVQSGAGTADLEHKQKIRRVLDKLEDRLRNDLSARTSDINRVGRTAKGDFKTHVFEKRKIAKWTQAAVSAGQVWSVWHHSTYSTFCVHRGEHTTKAVGYHNWNEEAMATMARELGGPWEDFSVKLQASREEIDEFVEDVTESALELLDNELGQSEVAVAPLTKALVARQSLFIDDVQQAFDAFEVGLRLIRGDSLSSIQSGYFGTAMETAYRAASREYGTGSHARRKRIIEDALDDDGLFGDLMKTCKKEFGTLADLLQENIQEAIGSYLEVVHGTLELLRNENVAQESERDTAFRERVDEGLRDAQGEIERIQDLLDG